MKPTKQHNIYIYIYISTVSGKLYADKLTNYTWYANDTHVVVESSLGE